VAVTTHYTGWEVAELPPAFTAGQSQQHRDDRRFARINPNFCRRVSFLIAASRFSAALWPRWRSWYTNLTGRRLRVYREAVPSLCCRVRRVRSVVMPVYNEPSAHRRMYTYQVRVGDLAT